MGGFTQFMMHKAEIVGATDQVHARLKRFEAVSGMTRSAGQARQSFSKRAVQPESNGTVQDDATARVLQHLLSLREQSMSHLSGDLHDPFFLRSLDHGANGQLRPDLQAGSSHSTAELDLLPEGPANTVGVRIPAVRQDEQGSQAERTSANLSQQTVCQAAITGRLDHASQPQARRDPHGQSHPRDHLVSFNGMITNDKFCMSRFAELHLGQWQLPLSLRAQAARQLAYHRERYPSSSSQAGDAYETTPLDSPPSDRQ